MLDFVISNQNSVLRRRCLPLLTNGNATAGAESLRLATCELQQKLDAIHFEVTRKGTRERISLRTVCIRPKQFQQEEIERNRHRFKAEKTQGGEIEISVTSTNNGNLRFRHIQARYDPNEIYEHPDFIANLTIPQRTILRQFYDGCNPRPMSDLVQGNGPALTVSTCARHGA